MSIKYDSNQSLSDEIYEILLEKIEHGEWKIGDKIPSENELSKTFSVSRISVRSAIQKLRAQNVLATRVGKGSFVISNHRFDNILTNSIDKIDLSRDEYKYIVELRQVLEFSSIKFICERGTEEDFKLLHSALLEMKNCNGDLDKYIQADYKFHYAIIKGSGNPLFVNVFRGCKDIFIKYFTEMAKATTDNFVRAISNHTNIYNSIITRNSKETISIIESTFEYNLNRLKVE